VFEALTEKLNSVFKTLRGHGTLSEKNIQDALKEVRMSFLEADVNYKVVKEFTDRVKERAIGREVMSSLTPGQQFIKIVHEELAAIMGESHQELQLSGKPPISVMLVGLQGSGKTTTIGKLGILLRSKGRRPLLVPADVYRPAAIDQLRTLGKQIEIPVFDSRVGQDPVQICLDAKKFADLNGQDILIIDTAGRLHIDDQMMEELDRIKAKISPNEILFVADAMTGQDAVNVAKTFNDRLEITGVILTKMDGDARGGAALSIKSVTGKPIKLVGIGEKLNALEPFHPDRMANRILDMGDVMTLIEKAEAAFDEKQAAILEKKLRRNEFTLEDFRDQLRQVRKLGDLEQIMSLLPGMGKLKALKGFKPNENELVKIEAIIDSMTNEERRDHTILNGNRRLRIAKGSGANIQDVNNLLKNYVQAKKMISSMSKSAGFLPSINLPGKVGLPQTKKYIKDKKAKHKKKKR